MLDLEDGTIWGDVANRTLRLLSANLGVEEEVDYIDIQQVIYRLERVLRELESKSSKSIG